MNKAILGIVFGALITFSAQADNTWLGNIRLGNIHRGSSSIQSYNGQAFALNICDYNLYTLYFDYYQAGVTDVSTTSIWQKLDAEVKLTQDATGNVIAQGPVSIAGMDGNNAVYQIPITSGRTNIAPSAVTGLDPNSKNTHMIVSLNNQVVASIPVQFSCNQN